MSKSKKKIHHKQIELIDIADKGLSLGKTIEGEVVFVLDTIPGDIVDVEVISNRRKFSKAKPIYFHRYSNKRVDPLCVHFGVCGGCKWQHLSYKWQLHFKQKQIRDHFIRIGGFLEPFELPPIIEAEKTYYYRNKLEFSFSDSKWLSLKEINSDEPIDKRALGFHIPARWDKVLDLEECHLQEAPSNEIRLAIRDYAKENDLSFYNPRKKEGFLRTLLIRISSIGEIMLLVQFYFEDIEKRTALLTFIKDKFPFITSLLYVINKKENDSIYDQEVHCFWGRDFIYEKMRNLTFRINAKSFYQTNSKQAYLLYKVIDSFAYFLDKEKSIIYDLYCGIGTIGQFLAYRAKKVIGIELVNDSIELARENVKENKIENAYFFSGDIKDIFNDMFVKEHGRADLVILDPPREGMHLKVVEMLLQGVPNHIIYVSCNSATQARDVGLLKEHYDIKKIQAVDMFPHTHHIENVILLEKKLCM